MDLEPIGYLTSEQSQKPHAGIIAKVSVYTTAGWILFNLCSLAAFKLLSATTTYRIDNAVTRRAS